MLAANGGFLGAVCGVVPIEWAPLQQAGDGEDFAFVMLVSLLMGPLDVYCDCKGTIACARDKATSVAASYSRRHMWWLHWWEQTELADIKVYKVRAHISVAECDGPQSATVSLGTEWACSQVLCLFP